MKSIHETVKRTGYCPATGKEREIELLCAIDHNSAIPVTNKCRDTHQCAIAQNCPIFEQ